MVQVSTSTGCASRNRPIGIGEGRGERVDEVGRVACGRYRIVRQVDLQLMTLADIAHKGCPLYGDGASPGGGSHDLARLLLHHAQKRGDSAEATLTQPHVVAPHDFIGRRSEEKA